MDRPPKPRLKTVIFSIVVAGFFLTTSGVVFAGDSLKFLTKKLNQQLKTKPLPILAVLNFPYSKDRSSTGSHLVSERCVTYLVQDGAVVVERRLLDRLLEERKLWQTGLVEPDSVKNVGSVLGVDAIVTGFLTDLSLIATEVLLRVVKVDTGEIIASVSGVIERVWADPPRLPRFAQARSAIPVVSINMESVQEQPEQKSAVVLRLEKHGKRTRYFPAPVPFALPTVPQPTQGRQTK